MSTSKRILICLGLLLTLLPIIMSRKGRKLPEHLAIGYAMDNETDELIVKGVENGLNVVIWFSCNLIDDNEKAKVQSTIKFNELVQRAKEIKNKGYDVTHLISIGGWAYPHPDDKHTAKEYFEAWEEFNKQLSDAGFEGFDGFDWDIEGHNDKENPGNIFKIKTLDIMGELSQLAKNAGYLVTMAPAESYLDATMNDFSLSLLLPYPEWVGKLQPEFEYHGRNIYAYLLKKYEFSENQVKTFDFISVQLYESYAHALYKYKHEGVNFGKILKNTVEAYKNGWTVNFSQVPETGLEDSIITVEPERLVIGMANTWKSKKILLIPKNQIYEAYYYLRFSGLNVRGFMYWNISQDTENYCLASIFSSLFK